MANSEGERGMRLSSSSENKGAQRWPSFILNPLPRLTESSDSMAIAMMPPPPPLYNTTMMTEEQFETLRRQIFVYATICSQLVKLHRATMDSMAQEALTSCLASSQQLGVCETDVGSQGLWMTTRHRWTPSHSQLQILEELFDKGLVNPSKEKIKETTADLIRHGPISETNVYNWFQNRKARAKRKQRMISQRCTESGIEETDESGSVREKKSQIQENSNPFTLDQSFTIIEANPQKQSGITPSISLECENINLSFDNLVPQDGYLLDTMDAIIDGNIWEAPSTNLNVDGNYGESVFLSSQPLYMGEHNTFTRVNSMEEQWL